MAVFSAKALEEFQDKEFRYAFIKETLRSRIAIQIRALRKQHGLSQKQLGELTGKHQHGISRLEDIAYGCLSVNTLLKLAEAYDVALIVEFCSFPRFTKDTEYMNETALEVSSFDGRVE